MNFNEQKIKQQALKNEFCELLRTTRREGIEYVIEDLQSLGFFDAPASTKFHLNHDGGLCEHSLNVCKIGMMLREEMIKISPESEPFLRKDSVIIATLLHDVCKADIYKKVVKTQKNTNDIWENVPGFDVDYSNFPMGHGEKSVIRLLLSGLELIDEEMLAIRWHMTAWDLAFQSPEQKNNLNMARDLYPLCALLQSADSLASNILERKRNRMVMIMD